MRFNAAPDGSRARRVLFGLYHAAMGMGVGGLLKEIPSRPEPRELRPLRLVERIQER